MGSNGLSVDAPSCALVHKTSNESDTLPAARSPLSTRPSQAEFEFDYYRSLCCCGLLHITTGAKIIGWVQLVTFMLYLCLPVGSVALANAMFMLGADQSQITLSNDQSPLAGHKDTQPMNMDYTQSDADYDVDSNYTIYEDGVLVQMPDDTGHAGDDEHTYYYLNLSGTQMTVIAIVLILMVIVLGVLPICVMLWGVHHRKQYLLLPYLFITALSVLLGAFCLNPLAILHTWFCYVVFRCYRHFRWCDKHPEFADYYGDPLLRGPPSNEKLACTNV